MEKIPYQDPNRKEGAVFNMAIATLEKVHSLLMFYSEVSITPRKNPSELIVNKFNIAKQLMIQTIPLLKKEDRAESKERFSKIQLKPGWIENRYTQKQELSYYNPVTENELDDYIIFLQELLQETHNYFMPSSKDARYGWKQQ